ncbi:Zn(II)2Cys6 transcription factor [Phanerochaete sordida]|uniref:Zn(II)2Cys6 transcription factor n=1 Tax=Phanerochaete sordida TaxID=48140 RepID=A0A9P3LHF4_9APHY|nr:Zn(II)2Cys6 transcription factor [Phanerochaete sordida]
MALLTTAAGSPSSSSHPSSPESDHPDMDPNTVLDPDASPVSPSSVPAAVALEAERDQGSPRSTPPSSSAADLARSRSTGRGGCWTCRVRRKKCDEERVDGDSCKTCRRLGIECLGWGVRRPDWMRDKEKVAEYKANIKAQLTRAGLIRGQPRAVYSTSTSSVGGMGLSSASSSSSDRYLAGPLAGPGPSSLRAGRSDPYASYAHARAYDSSRYHAAGNVNSVMSAMTGLDALSASPELSIPSPFVMSHDPFNQASLPYSNDLSSMSSTSSYPPFLHTPETSPSITPGLRDSPFNEQPEPYIQYYFEHMRHLQFSLAGKELAQTLAFILAGDPQGPLEYAICALASLHSSKANAHAYDAAASAAEHADRTIDRRFYNKAYVMLMTSKATGRPYTERDAIAAVYLISYHNLAGGGTGWTALLEVAYEWFGQTGIHEEQNPKLALMNMSPTQKLAAKATMWIDTLASVVFTRPPRFLSLYRRLFGNSGGGGYWATTNNDQLDLRMDKLTGCPDEAVLALAETAALAHWKVTEGQKGTLSMRELIRRGDLIESTLRNHPSRNYADSPIVENASMLPTGLAAAAEAASPTLGSGVDELTRRTIANIWREAAVLYLHTVISDAHPGVPEILKATNTIMDYLQLIGPSESDRAILLPFVLTGCMTDDPLIRELVKQRLHYHRDDFYNGSMSQGRTFVEYVANRRQAARHSHRANVTVDWRECMRERWSAITLV